MNAILSIKSKTIKEVADSLEATLIQNGQYVPTNLGYLIRWGSTRQTPPARIEINSPKAIKKASDKALCRKILYEHSIPVPRDTATRFPVIGRKAHHSHGRGFFVCRSDEDVRRARKRGCTYFSEFYPKTHEYRVHVGHGKILFYSEKVGGSHKYIWNHARGGYVFRVVPRQEWRPEVFRPAKMAINALGLHFGAVDILADAGSAYPKAVVCEVNTAPALSPYGVDKYYQYFKKILSGEYEDVEDDIWSDPLILP